MACIVMQALIVVSNLFSSYLPRRMILNLPCCERSTTVEAILLSPSTSAYFGPPSILPQSSTRSLLEGSTQRFNKRDCRGPKQSWTCKITFAVTLMKLSAEVLPELSLMERQQKKIIVDGALDVSKSTLSRNMCKDWRNCCSSTQLVTLKVSGKPHPSEDLNYCVDDADLKQQVAAHLYREPLVNTYC